MPRFALKIEYDGAPFHGWQRQAGGLLSVQQAIEEALARLEPAEHRIAGAGRTDAGVHAIAQVAHCDLAREWEPFRLSQALNWHLKPLPVAVTACAVVPDGFHARFSACERRYLYRIVARRAPLTHDRGLIWQVPNALDLAGLQEAAAHLVGQHDFTTFRSSICQANSPIKTMDDIRIEMASYPGGMEYQFHLRARSFLHNQVRSIVGTLERVGAGSWTPQDVALALAARDRAACGPVAPPHGLYLVGVGYPEELFSN